MFFMILDFMFNYKLINKKPYLLIFNGIIYSTLALVLSLIVFRSNASLVMVFFTVMACIPLVYNTIKHEEHEDIVLKSEVSKLREHAKALSKFMYLFLGFVVSFSIWYLVMPDELIGDAYETQLETISEINGGIDYYEEHNVPTDKLNGNLLKVGFPVFLSILLNNTIVMLFCLTFSLVYGLGAIFILTWNASVIGAAIGSIVKAGLEQVSTHVGSHKFISMFAVILNGFLRFTLHGIPEIAAYFVAGLAGGIISVAVIKHDLRSQRFKKVLFDAMDLSFIAIGLVIFSAFIEVYITPVFFF